MCALESTRSLRNLEGTGLGKVLVPVLREVLLFWVLLRYGSMYLNSIYFGHNDLYRDYFKANVYTLWPHGPLEL